MVSNPPTSTKPISSLTYASTNVPMHKGRKYYSLKRYNPIGHRREREKDSKPQTSPHCRKDMKLSEERTSAAPSLKVLAYSTKNQARTSHQTRKDLRQKRLR